MKELDRIIRNILKSIIEIFPKTKDQLSYQPIRIEANNKADQMLRNIKRDTLR